MTGYGNRLFTHLQSIGTRLLLEMEGIEGWCPTRDGISCARNAERKAILTPQAEDLMNVAMAK